MRQVLGDGWPESLVQTRQLTSQALKGFPLRLFSVRGRRRRPTPVNTFHSASDALCSAVRSRTAQAPEGTRQYLSAVATIGAAVLIGAGITAVHDGATASGPELATQSAVAGVVQASPEAAITFDRPKVDTASAPAVPQDVPEPAVHAAPAPAPTVSAARLAAPLASMSVSSPFGLRTSPVTGASGQVHRGLDLAASCQTAVFAAGAGTVVEAGWSANGGGNRIVVDHGNGLQSTYNHLASVETSAGGTVAVGQRLAAAGTTGNSTGCHLHFEVLLDGQIVNPQGWI